MRLSTTFLILTVTTAGVVSGQPFLQSQMGFGQPQQPMLNQVMLNQPQLMSGTGVGYNPQWMQFPAQPQVYDGFGTPAVPLAQAQAPVQPHQAWTPSAFAGSPITNAGIVPTPLASQFQTDQFMTMAVNELDWNSINQARARLAEAATRPHRSITPTNRLAVPTTASTHSTSDDKTPSTDAADHVSVSTTEPKHHRSIGTAMKHAGATMKHAVRSFFSMPQVGVPPPGVVPLAPTPAVAGAPIVAPVTPIIGPGPVAAPIGAASIGAAPVSAVPVGVAPIGAVPVGVAPLGSPIHAHASGAFFATPGPFGPGGFGGIGPFGPGGLFGPKKGPFGPLGPIGLKK